MQILATKLYIPPLRPGAVQRPRLIERLNAGLHGKLTLISAPAGFGKTTLVSEWIADSAYPAAWLALDDGDSDPARFLIYLITALQTIAPHFGEGMEGLLQSPQPPPLESLLTSLLNEMATMPDDFILVLDDYHALDNKDIHSAVSFLIDHLPPQMHLVITTREDPQLPLARLRVRGQLNELRAGDLRFSHDEAAHFLNQGMNLNLSVDDIAALETRTEGWVAGLQLAALSMQGQKDITQFIQSFTGSHHFVLDYLVEEVLHQQPEYIQSFLLYTSILERMCGPLCDAVLPGEIGSGQQSLEMIQQANLFLIPMDNERRWFRYHHLFGDLLRQRLHQHLETTQIDDLHNRASLWYAENGFEVEAFRHAAAANNIERAEQLIESSGVPLYFRGAAHPVLHWLAALPTDVMDARPSLWLTYAWTLMAAHQNLPVESKLQAAETALRMKTPDNRTRDLQGHIAAIRAMLAANHYQTDTIIAESHRALEQLHPDNQYVRTVVMRTLAIAYQFRGERAAARDAYIKAIAMSEASGNFFINVLATTGLGIIQLSDNQLYQAAETYQRVLELVGDPRQPIACAAFAGLAQISYQWNDLDTAQQQGEQSVHLSQQIDSIDSAAAGEIFLARLMLTQGDVARAAAKLAEIEQFVRQRNFVKQIPAVAENQVLILLQQGDVIGAERLAAAHDLPLSQARVRLAQGDTTTALSILKTHHQEMEAKDWQDELLNVRILQALAHYQHGDLDAALAVAGQALTAAAPGGLIRIFVDEGSPMMKLLSEAAARGIMPDYTRKLLAAFPASESKPASVSALPMLDPLSDRELEVLQLVAQGLSNREISERLFLALSTVKGHNRIIFDKLHVKRRTEAVARALELGLL